MKYMVLIAGPEDPPGSTSPERSAAYDRILRWWEEQSSSGKVITSLPAVGMVDDMSYDTRQRRIYLAGDQFVDVFEQKDPDHYVLLAKIPGSFRAKTGILIPQLNRYYLAAPRHGDKDAEVRVYEVQP